MLKTWVGKPKIMKISIQLVIIFILFPNIGWARPYMPEIRSEADLMSWRRYCRSAIASAVCMPVFKAFVLPILAPGLLPPWRKQTRFPFMATCLQRFPVDFAFAWQRGSLVMSQGIPPFFNRPKRCS